MLHNLKGAIALILAVTNVLVMAIPFFSAVLFKFLLPSAAIKRGLTQLITALAWQYNRNNAWIFQGMSHIEWLIMGAESLRKDGSYLVMANHQSWADIPVLQCVLEKHIPLLKFFLKKELLFVPILGAAWWALDFPFMKRHSREFLEKYPGKRGEDLAETKRMCERFKHSPVSVMNFLEGTRFSPEKRDAQQSPYQRLLKPKAGGAALVISSMGGGIQELLDITLRYDYDGEVNIWKLFSGQIPAIEIHINTLPIPAHFAEKDYESDQVYRQEFKGWIDALWKEKDKKLSPPATS